MSGGEQIKICGDSCFFENGIQVFILIETYKSINGNDFVITFKGIQQVLISLGIALYKNCGISFPTDKVKRIAADFSVPCEAYLQGWIKQI